MYKFAMDVIFKTSKRLSVETEHICDAGLCHGTTGIAHLYARIYNYSFDERYRDLSAYWYTQTIEYLSNKQNIQSYKSYNGENWIGDLSILEGLSGIGLSFISAISKIEPKWDKSIMIS